MYPVLFTVGSFPIRSYGVSIVIALLIAMAVAKWIARRRGRPYAAHIEDLVIYLLVGGILGARVWEVTFSWDYFSAHPWEILAIWHGGISIQGAIAGGAVAAALWCRARKVAFADLADTLAPAVVLAQGLGRLTACVLNGDAYGRPTGLGWGITYPPGSPAYAAFGDQPLWPAEIFEGLWDLALFFVLLRMVLRGDGRPGTVALWYALLYSIGRYSLEFLRADSLMIGGVKAAQLTSVIIALVAAALLAYRARSRRVST